MSLIDKSGPKRALIYNRASRASAGQRVSVESQDGENRAWCAREGWEVAASITDNGLSASRYATRTREGYEQVKEAVTGRTFGPVDVLVCWESSRAQRGLGDYVAVRDLCAELGVWFAYSGRVYDLTDDTDRYVTGLDALRDEQESDKISKRSLRGHRTSAAKGDPRGPVPFGFRRCYDATTGKLSGQEPCPDTAPVVRGIVDRVLSGDSLYSIARDLNAEEVPTPNARSGRRGRQARTGPRGWSSSQIRQMLLRETLMGVRVHRAKNGSVSRVPAKWEPIVSPSDWQKVSAILTGPGRRISRGTAPQHLLSGIAECSECGGWLRPLLVRGRRTYQCGGVKDAGRKGCVSRDQEKLDKFVELHMIGYLSRPGFLERLQERSTDSAAEDRQRLRAELDQTEAELAEYVQLASAGDVSPKSFAAIERVKQAKIEELRRKLAPAWFPAALYELAGPDAAGGWEAASDELKRTALRTLVRVIVHPVDAARRGKSGVDSTFIEVREI